MGCLNSKASEEEDNQQSQNEGESHRAPQKYYTSENDTRDGANDPRESTPNLLRRSSETATVAQQSAPLSRRAHHSSERAIAVSSFGTEHYDSRKCFIINNAAGQPHLLSADAVNEKLQQIREELKGHNNDLITDAEREYFAEQRCWNFLFPDQKEIFMVYRPKSAITEETMPEFVPNCEGCADLAMSMDFCPWTVSTACPIFHHKKYNVRFGYEVLFGCPQCQAEEQEQEQGKRI